MPAIRAIKQDSPSWFGYPGWTREQWDLWHRYGDVQAERKRLRGRVAQLERENREQEQGVQYLQDILMEVMIVHEGRR